MNRHGDARKMASGRTHARVAKIVFVTSTISAVGITYAAGVKLDSYALATLTGLSLGFYAGIYITPDLDVDNGNISYATMRKKGGWLGGKLWAFFWRSYARRQPHRGVSHTFIRGTASRWSYIFWRGAWPFILGLCAYLWFADALHILPIVATFFLAAFIAMSLQDLGHIVFDQF